MCWFCSKQFHHTDSFHPYGYPKSIIIPISQMCKLRHSETVNELGAAPQGKDTLLSPQLAPPTTPGTQLTCSWLEADTGRASLSQMTGGRGM